MGSGGCIDMRLRFNEVPRDAETIEATGFLDRKDGVRVAELIGRSTAVEAAWKKTAPRKRIEDVIRGVATPPRALMGALLFGGDEDTEEATLRRLAERWEADFLPGFTRHEHYEILWHHLNWGNAHELRFFMPLWDKTAQAPLAVPKGVADKADVWTKVQVVTFGFRDPFQGGRHGPRPEFRIDPKKSLRFTIIEHIEEAVLAGDLRSRRDVIADLGRIGFEVVSEDDLSVSIRYGGADEELAKKGRRAIELTGPAFGAGFGQVADPRIMQLEAAQRGALASLREEAKRLTGQVPDELKAAVDREVERRVNAALVTAQKGMDERITSFELALDQAVTGAVEEVREHTAGASGAVVAAREELGEALGAHAKTLAELRARESAAAERELQGAYAVVRKLTADVDQVRKLLDDKLQRQESVIQWLRWSLGGAALMIFVLVGMTGYFAISGTGQIAKIAMASARLDNQQAELDAHREVLTATRELHAQAQAALQGMAQSLSGISTALQVERKADGSSALTVYTRRLPSVRDCERDASCIAQLDNRSR